MKKGAIQVWADSHVGLCRSRNEDSFLVKTFPQGLLLAVADGMGGETAGAEASAIVTDCLDKSFSLPPSSLDQAAFQLEQALLSAHQKIRLYAESLSTGTVMGSTASATWISQNGEVIAQHVGDSRIYQLRTDRIVQRSEDHTLVQELLLRGIITVEEAANHPHKNLLCRSVGGGEVLFLDEPIRFCLEQGDGLLLCSDGLTGHLGIDEIPPLLTEKSKSVQQLINLANSRGGHDNITVIYARYSASRRPYPLYILALILFLCAIVLATIMLARKPVPSTPESLLDSATTYSPIPNGGIS